jgi:phage protein D
VKTFKEFQEAVVLAAPLLAPAALTFAAGAAANILKAKRQGEGGRSQPVDYGQGGSTQSRKPAVQRGRLNANDAYNKQKKAERKAEAQRRAREKAEQGIDSLIGSDAERKAAAEARANQPQIQRRLRQQAMRERMRKAAERQGLD